MDDRGYWHDAKQAEISKAVDELRREAREGSRPMAPERPVIEIAYGEMVSVVKQNGETLMGTFDAAEKNKVTISPDASKPRPYMELAEPVRLTRATGESVRAQVWDNRNGKLILRTLPL